MRLLLGEIMPLPKIVQRNTMIAFLQEQVHELQMELGDSMDHIGMLHEQPIPPVVPAEPAVAEEDPEEIEGVSEIDFEHAFAEPNPQPDDSSSSSASSVGNLNDF